MKTLYAQGAVWNFEGGEPSAQDVGAILLKDGFDDGTHYDIEMIACERIVDSDGNGETCFPSGVVRPRAVVLTPGDYRLSYRCEGTKNGEDFYSSFEHTMFIGAGTAYEAQCLNSVVGKDYLSFRHEEISLQKSIEAVTSILRQVEEQRIAEIESVSFVKHTAGMARMLNNEGDPIFSTFVGPTGCAGAVVSDIFESPTKTVRLIDLHNQAALPSTWGRPDSMIAKAFRPDQKSSPKLDDPIIVATGR